MVVLGIDPSLTQTCVVCGTSPTDFTVSWHKSKPLGDTVADRVARYDRLVASIMKAVDAATLAPFTDINQAEFLPCRIFIENYSFGSKWDQHSLAELGGILRWHLVDRDEALKEVAPARLKKFVCGGGAKKEMMLMKCLQNWGYEAKGNDDADAFGLYRLGLCACGLDVPQNAAQREVIEKINAV